MMIPILGQPHYSNPRFQGQWATRCAQEKLLNEDELKSSLDAEKPLGKATPYIGERLPKVFFSPVGNKNHQKQAILKTLDIVSGGLRQFDVGLYRSAGFIQPFKFPPLRVKLGNKMARLTYLGSGNFGSAFNLSIGGQQFTFKTFFKRHRDLLYSGPYSEAALGEFITAQNVCNMPHLLVANPQAGWQLTEFIGPNFKNTHAHGPRWQELGLKVLDPVANQDNEKTDGNNVKYRIDYGHLTTEQRRRPLFPRPQVEFLFSHLGPDHFVPLKAYWQLFKQLPEVREQLFRNLGCLSPKNRLKVIQRVLKDPEFADYPTQDFFKAKVLTEKAILPLFRFLSIHPNPAVRSKAIFNPTSWPEAEKQKIFEPIWNAQPEFIPFLIYRGRYDLLPGFLKRHSPMLTLATP